MKSAFALVLTFSLLGVVIGGGRTALMMHSHSHGAVFAMK
jgi:hypothetical protein